MIQPFVDAGGAIVIPAVVVLTFCVGCDSSPQSPETGLHHDVGVVIAENDVIRVQHDFEIDVSDGMAGVTFARKEASCSCLQGDSPSEFVLNGGEVAVSLAGRAKVSPMPQRHCWKAIYVAQDERDNPQELTFSLCATVVPQFAVQPQKQRGECVVVNSTDDAVELNIRFCLKHDVDPSEITLTVDDRPISWTLQQVQPLNDDLQQIAGVVSFPPSSVLDTAKNSRVTARLTATWPGVVKHHLLRLTFHDGIRATPESLFIRADRGNSRRIVVAGATPFSLRNVRHDGLTARSITYEPDRISSVHEILVNDLKPTDSSESHALVVVTSSESWREVRIPVSVLRLPAEGIREARTPSADGHPGP